MSRQPASAITPVLCAFFWNIFFSLQISGRGRSNGWFSPCLVLLFSSCFDRFNEQKTCQVNFFRCENWSKSGKASTTVCVCVCVHVTQITTPIDFTWVYSVWSKRLNENSNGMEHTIPYCKAIKIMIYTHLKGGKPSATLKSLWSCWLLALLSLCENLPKISDQLVKSFIPIEERDRKKMFSQRVFSS